MKNSNLLTILSKYSLFIALSLIALVQLYPLIWLLLSSLNANSDLFIGSIFPIPPQIQWENYTIAWNQGSVPQYFLNSAFVVTITVIVSIYISFTMGYAFTRLRWKGRNIVFALILLGIMLPVHVTLLPNYLIFTRLGIHRNFLSLLIPYIAFSFPIGVYVMGGYLESVPKELEESTFIDGCGLFQTMFLVIFPMTRPAVMAISILTFLFSWNEYIMAATFLRANALRTLPFSITTFTGQYSSNFAAQFAVMSLSAAPAILIYLLLSQKITGGIMAGAIKG